jgi:RIO kinase 1
VRFQNPNDFFDSDDDLLSDFVPADRKARRSRKGRTKPVPKKRDALQLETIAETVGLESGFATTYKPSKHESGWLLESLRTFYDQSLLVDVLAVVKGGKEASVYRAEPHPRLGLDSIAAKVYRPHIFRQFRNDSVYREGRAVLNENGKLVKGNEHRIMRAIGKDTAFGRQVAHTSWLMYEYTTMQTLHALGAAVPVPIAASENAILMSYIGDEQMAAPPLADVELEPDERKPLFDEILRNIDLMLANGWIHGDLSAYNILYWDGDITLIDFPQVTQAHGNSQAYSIFERDITRITEYFATQGYARDPQAITRALWHKHMARNPRDVAADLSRFETEEG